MAPQWASEGTEVLLVTRACAEGSTPPARLTLDAFMGQGAWDVADGEELTGPEADEGACDEGSDPDADAEDAASSA